MVQLHIRADPNSNYGPVFLGQTTLMSMLKTVTPTTHVTAFLDKLNIGLSSE